MKLYKRCPLSHLPPIKMEIRYVRPDTDLLTVEVVRIVHRCDVGDSPEAPEECFEIVTELYDVDKPSDPDDVTRLGELFTSWGWSEDLKAVLDAH